MASVVRAEAIPSEFRHADPVKFGELVASQGLDGEEGFGHPCTNWSRSEAVLLMSPRQGETSHHMCSLVDGRGQAEPHSGSKGVPHGSSRCAKLQARDKWYQSGCGGQIADREAGHQSWEEAGQRRDPSLCYGGAAC